MTSQQKIVDGQREIVETIRRVLREYFAHAPLKAQPSKGPVRTSSIDQVCEALRQLPDSKRRPPDFEQGLLTSVTLLRDVHTAYTLSQPQDELLYYLPFMLRRWQDGGTDRYVVARVLQDKSPGANVVGNGRAVQLDGSNLREEAEVKTWNGRPIAEVIRKVADGEEGAHLEASMALGLAVLTSRWMGGSPAFDNNEKVNIEFDIDGATYQQEFQWQHIHVPQALRLELQARDLVFSSRSINRRSRVAQLLRKQLFVSTTDDFDYGADLALTEPSFSAHPLKDVQERFDQDFDPKILQSPHGTFGYVRIRSFDFDDDLVVRFKELLEVMPQSGLIIDLRENPGGSIENAERMLQLLTPNEVRPTGFRFAATRLTEALTRPSDADGENAIARNVQFADWHASIVKALEAQEPYSEPLEYSVPMNDLGQRYYGPCVAIVDALTFSAAEMFAAGFKDNGIGQLIGAGDHYTGGAGALVWTLKELKQEVGPGGNFADLHEGAELRFAALQCVRIANGNKRFGHPFEAKGIKVDIPHQLTKADAVQRGKDLLLAAAKHLDEYNKNNPGRASLAVSLEAVEENRKLELKVQATNARRLVIDVVQEDPYRDIPIQVQANGDRAQLTLDRRFAHVITVTALGLDGRKVYWKDEDPMSDEAFEEWMNGSGGRGSYSAGQPTPPKPTNVAISARAGKPKPRRKPNKPAAPKPRKPVGPKPTNSRPAKPAKPPKLAKPNRRRGKGKRAGKRAKKA